MVLDRVRPYQLMLSEARSNVIEGPWGKKVAMLLVAATVLCAALYADLTAASTLAELFHDVDLGEVI